MVSETAFLNNILSQAPFTGRLFIGDYLVGVKNVVSGIENSLEIPVNFFNYGINNADE